MIRRDAGGRGPGGDPLQDQAHLVCIQDFRAGWLENSHAPIGDAFCHSRCHQEVKGFADRSHADSEAPSHLVLSQPGAGSVLAGQDVLVKDVKDLVLQGLASEGLIC